ncbi:MAG: hypothetical protein ACREI3_11120, partial [Nitrospirales bacterium]
TSKTMTLRTKVLSLYDAIKPWLGEHDPQQVQQALEHELRPMLPTWTDAKPICPGWYWQKPPGVTEPRLVYVDNGRIDTKLMADLGPPLNLVDVNRILGQWAGPLEPVS